MDLYGHECGQTEGGTKTQWATVKTSRNIHDKKSEEIDPENFMDLLSRDIGGCLTPEQMKPLHEVIHEEVQRVIKAHPEICVGKSSSSAEILKHFSDRAKVVYQQCFVSNIPLVIYMVRKYYCRYKSLPEEEKISLCLPGLVRALIKFDPLHDKKFSTYAFHWISRSFMRLFNKESRIVEIPDNIIEHACEFRKIFREEGVHPQEQGKYIEKNMKYKNDSIHETVLRICRSEGLGHVPIDLTDEEEDKWVIRDNTSQSFIEDIERKDEREIIGTIMKEAGVKCRDSIIMTLLLGIPLPPESVKHLNPEEQKRLEELDKAKWDRNKKNIGYIFGVTEEAIRLRENSAIVRLNGYRKAKTEIV